MNGSFVSRQPGNIVLLMLLIVAGGTGCSLVLDPSKEQCATTFDCRDRGVNFSEAVCVDHLCESDPQWSCVDTFVPPPPQEERDAMLQVSDIFEQSRGVPGVHATLHTLLDFDLANPVDEGDTDAAGQITLHLPQGFVGFVALSAEGMIEPSLFYPDLPIAAADQLGLALVGAPGADDGLLRLLGETPVPERGGLFLQLRDCAGGGGAGAALRFDNNMAGSRVYYVASGLPSAQVSEFDDSGVGGVANGNPGLFSINVLVEGKTVSAKSVIVRPDTLTVTTMRPGSVILAQTGQ